MKGKRNIGSVANIARRLVFDDYEDIVGSCLRSQLFLLEEVLPWFVSA